MILLAGASGSGKTTVTKQLETMGYTIIPTYTTRRPRPDDFRTICVSEVNFSRMLVEGSFISYHTFNSEMGKVSYGIPAKEYLVNPSKSVIIVAKEYYDDIVKYANDYTEDNIFMVYLDVDTDTIVSRCMNDTLRGMSNIDLRQRLKRDMEKNESLKHDSNLVIINDKYRFTPEEISYLIKSFYESFSKTPNEGVWDKNRLTISKKLKGGC